MGGSTSTNILPTDCYVNASEFFMDSNFSAMILLSEPNSSRILGPIASAIVSTFSVRQERLVLMEMPGLQKATCTPHAQIVRSRFSGRG